jgi:hypothetical protein
MAWYEAWSNPKYSPGLRRLLHKAALLRERGGLPPKPGERARSVEDRVRELRWQASRFAEIIAWDRDIAEDIVDGNALFHLEVMSMRLYTGQYDAEDGDDLYEVDKWVQQRIDPTVDVRR